MKRHARSTFRFCILDKTVRLYPDPRALRESLGMTALEFADAYGFAVGTVRDWDCGRYEPDRMARAYLRRIQEIADVPIGLVSVGQGRDQTIVC